MIDFITKLLDQGPQSNNGQYKSKASLDHSVFAIIWVWTQLRSKDPNTKVGAGVYETTTGALHLGYNGFNRDVPDSMEVWNNRNPDVSKNKYSMVVHAEVNAMVKALRAGFDPSNSILFCTHYPCHRCMKDIIIPSGIKSIRYMYDYSPFDKLTEEMANTTGIKITKVHLQ